MTTPGASGACHPPRRPPPPTLPWRPFPERQASAKRAPTRATPRSPTRRRWLPRRGDRRSQSGHAGTRLRGARREVPISVCASSAKPRPVSASSQAGMRIRRGCPLRPPAGARPSESVRVDAGASASTSGKTGERRRRAICTGSLGAASATTIPHAREDRGVTKRLSREQRPGSPGRFRNACTRARQPALVEARLPLAAFGSPPPRDCRPWLQAWSSSAAVEERPLCDWAPQLRHGAASFSAASCRCRSVSLPTLDFVSRSAPTVGSRASMRARSPVSSARFSADCSAITVQPAAISSSATARRCQSPARASFFHALRQHPDDEDEDDRDGYRPDAGAPASDLEGELLWTLNTRRMHTSLSVTRLPPLRRERV